MIKNLILTLCFFMTAFYTFAQREAELLTRTHWKPNVQKMEQAYQTKYANFEEDISNLNDEEKQAAIDKKAEKKMVLSVLSSVETHFNADKKLVMYAMGNQVGKGTWEITPTSLSLYTEHGDENYQLVEISENAFTVIRENGDVIYYEAKNPIQTSTSSQNNSQKETSSTKTSTSNTKNSAPISYKGMSLTMPGNTINFQLTYKATDLKIESFSLGMVSTYCDCKVEIKDGYETGNCTGQQFNEGNKGMYIKNSKGVIVVGYYTSGQATPAMLLAPTDALLEEALTSDVEETEKMAALLAEWYKLW